MDRIWRPADQFLAGIGRFVRLKPKLTILFILMVLSLTLVNNGFWPLRSSTVKPSAQPLTLPTLHQATAETSTPLTPVQTAPSVPTPLVGIVPQSPKFTNLTQANTTHLILPQPNIDKYAAATLPTLTYLSGKVRHNFLLDAHKIGLPFKQAYRLQQLFSKESPRPGDKFSVLYGLPQTSKKNVKTIVAAELFHSGKRFALIQFVDPKGHADFYTPQGESLREGFLRAPVKYTYVSSLFSRSRLEPLLHFRRPHLGVDYAAPTGTPIVAAALGTIVEMNEHGGYGNVVVIKHGNDYSTLYAHMSRFAANLHVGSSVNRGQVIGYVGQTGLATGPHLHYEIHVHDVAENPLTVPLPGLPIDKKYRNAFFAQSKKLMSEFNAEKNEVNLAEETDTTRRS